MTENNTKVIDASKFNLSKYVYNSGYNHPQTSPTRPIKVIKKMGRYVSPYFNSKYLTKEERDVARAQSAKRYRNDPLRKYESYVQSAVRRGKDWNLDREQAIMLFRSSCHYCGKPSSDDNLNGIDRVDNDVGYHVDNVVACCSACNMCKGRHDLKMWLRTCLRVASHWKNESANRHDRSDDDSDSTDVLSI